jgi:hypothetical protein
LGGGTLQAWARRRFEYWADGSARLHIEQGSAAAHLQIPEIAYPFARQGSDQAQFEGLGLGGCSSILLDSLSGGVGGSFFARLTDLDDDEPFLLGLKNDLAPDGKPIRHHRRTGSLGESSPHFFWGPHPQQLHVQIFGLSRVRG